MKYRRAEKVQAFSMVGLIIGGILIIWGIIVFAKYSLLNLAGYILIGLGVIIILYEFWRHYSRYRFRNKVLLEFEDNPSSSIDDLAKRTCIGKEVIRHVVLDLRGSGKIQGLFSGETGHLETLLVGKEDEIKDRYCAQCGSNITKKDQFYCRYCGRKISQ